MNKIIVTLIFALMVSGCSEPATDSTPNPESHEKNASNPVKTGQSKGIFDYDYRIKDLSNGLRVVVIPTDYPDVVAMHIPVQTGSRNEIEPGKSGFAHFFEHMMFKGTQQYPADKYQSILKNAGGDQNAYTSDDYTNYHTTFLKADLEKMIEMEADRFQNLQYTEDEFRTEALAVKGEYLKNSSTPIRKWLEKIRDTAFETHTYKHTTMGFLRDIEDMPNQYEYGQEFFKRWYSPDKTVIVLVGDLDADNTFGLVEKYWGNWKASGYAVDIPVENIGKRDPQSIHLEWESPTQPWVVVTFHGPEFNATEKDMPAIDLISQLYFSRSSDFYQKLVVKETKVDQFFAYTPSRKDPGLLYFAARLTDPQHAAYVRDEVIDTLVKTRTQLVDQSRLADLKSNLKYSFAGGLDNSEAIASTLASFIHFDRRVETINELYATYDSLTAEDLLEAANKYFVDNARITLTLAHQADLEGFDQEPDMALMVKTASSSSEPAFQIIDKTSSSPLLDVSVLMHTGAAFDPAGKKGLAALTAMMLTEASSANYSYRDLQKGYYPLASGVYAQVDKEMTVLRSSVHRDNFDAWYTLVSDQLLNPAWDEDDFNRLKTRLKNNISTDLKGNNDEELGKEVLYTSLYGPQHPYGSYNLGSLKDLDSLTIEDVKQFYQQHYSQANLTLGLAGDFSDEHKQRLITDLSSLPQGEKNNLTMEQPAPVDGHQAIIVEKETMATAISMGFPIDKVRGDKDWVALWLVRSWLGEHRNSSSHLYKRIREQRGMNYGDYAYIEYFPRGMFLTQPNTNLGRQQQIFQMWIRPLKSINDAHFATRTAYYELDKLIKNGLTQEQFESSRNYLSKYASLLQKSQSRQLGYALDSAYYGTPDFVTYIRSELDNLTLDDVNRTIRENLQVENMQFVFITKDGTELKNRLMNDTASPMTYNSPKPEAIMEEDKILQDLKLNFSEDAITIVPVEEVFK